jgi:hypothetical protein
MRICLKATRIGQIQKSTKGGNRRRSQIGKRSARSPRNLSSSNNKTIWHNWLTEENYLG